MVSDDNNNNNRSYKYKGRKVGYRRGACQYFVSTRPTLPYDITVNNYHGQIMVIHQSCISTIPTVDELNPAIMCWHRAISNTMSYESTDQRFFSFRKKKRKKSRVYLIFSCTSAVENLQGPPNSTVALLNCGEDLRVGAFCNLSSLWGPMN